MKPIIIDKDNSSVNFLYEQLYKDIKSQIISGEMLPGDKCPSIRGLASDLDISVTTVMEAYNQLTAEGYIKNRPGSGYYVERVILQDNQPKVKTKDEADSQLSITSGASEYIYDEDAFDFIKWKKCASRVFTEYSSELLYGSDIKGEIALRSEIADYLFRSRGVHTSASNIIIAAGTQQTVFHLGRILKQTGINLVSVERPGYSPVKSMFLDAGFTTADIPVTDSGISVEALPVNIPSAVYVSPSNQFPTGVVMPVARRYEILNWASKNSSYIIEDDYNSELRYFGKPLPSLRSLDDGDRVIYLGSFSSTLFSAIRISYMVLPDSLVKVFDEVSDNYSQTCSKSEQLTLADFMSEGYYYTALRKKRAMYTKKLRIVEYTFERCGYDGLSLINTNSGLFVTVKIGSAADASLFIDAATKLKIYTSYIRELSSDTEKYISLYYSYIPMDMIDRLISELINAWKSI